MLKRLSTKPYSVPALLVLTAVLIAGCSSSDSGPTEPGPGDTTPPAVSSVTAPDRSHFQVLFSEAVDRATAENTANYEILRQGVAPKLAESPGDTLGIQLAALLSDGKTVRLSINSDMTGGENYDVRVSNVKDTSGNAMTGTSSTSVAGTDTPDTTPPVITNQDPAPGATGVGVGQAVNVTFSEPMEDGSVESAFSLTGPSGDVPVNADRLDGSVYSFRPADLLTAGATYTAAFASNTARDRNSNFLAPSSWSFTTSGTPDTNPPTLVSTTPADEATNVDLNIVLRLEFSEAIDPVSGDSDGILITPDLGDGTVVWVDGGRTLMFDPDSALMDNTTYSLVIIEGAVRDLAGNPLSGNYSATFTTSSTLPTGAISGTISGDSRSAAASSPEGTLVVGFMENLLTWDGDQGAPPIGGVGVAAGNGDYSILHLTDAIYWPAAFLDADGDGEITPEKGDAIGAYGVDFHTLMGDPIASEVLISGGIPATGIDFTMYDLMGIWGEVSYGGSAHSGNLEQFQFYAGLFDTTGFDPENVGNPVLGTNSQSIVYEREYIFSEFNDGLQAGTYYVGAYLDVNPGDGEGYNPAVDPIGFYMMGNDLGPVTVVNGSDEAGIEIVLADPPVAPPRGHATGSWAVVQPTADMMSMKLRRAVEAVNRATE
jgi:hypothetical protein